MHLDDLYQKALQGTFLSQQEGEMLISKAPTSLLVWIAETLRKKVKKDNVVTWIIDRNVNTTNICVANCKFCNFFRPPNHPDGYITSIQEYEKKIKETFDYGGEQLLLQGGHHPDLGLDFYVNLFKSLKERFPKLKLHALGPPEIVHITEMEKSTYKEVLIALMDAGMDSIPGAGAEILNDRVRRLVSKGKCNSQQWLDVMKQAHQLGLPSSATMMFGHVETIPERIEHLIKIRDLQAEKPESSKGFLAFIPWTFQDEGTLLKKIRGIQTTTTADQYLRMIAISRIMLPNIDNLQASWLTVGKEIAQLALHAGANDFGSIMIEENVVSAAGAPFRFTYKQIQDAIIQAGFTPQLRRQDYSYRAIPENIQEQIISY